MKIDITEHDKKLLLFLTMLVLIVCIGYWGIRPQLQAAASYKEELQEAQAVEKQNTMKQAQLSSVELYNEELETLIAEQKETKFSMMNSEEVEAYMTELLLKYDLFIYELSIDLSENASSLQPYIYSQKALSGQSIVQENAQALEIPVMDETDDQLFGDEQEAQSAGIYTASVSLRVGGSKTDVWKLLDDLAAEGTGLRLGSFDVYPGDDGEMRLDLSLEMYMCEK